MKYLLIIFATFLTNYAFCCTCGPKRSVTEEFEKSDKVVIGIILSVDPIYLIDSTEYERLVKNGLDEANARILSSNEGYYQYEMVLSEPAYKGTFATDTIFIRTSLDIGSCRYSFQIGKKYVVYGYNRVQVPR